MTGFFTLFLFALVARAEPFHGLPYETLHVRSFDGAELSLLHFEAPQANAPVVLLEPGLLENATMFEGATRAFRARGYEVYIGQVRLAGRGADRSGSAGDHDGLEEVLLQDLPAHLRGVIARHPNTPISLVGHSMGGMEILATLSDDQLRAEFAPHIKAISLIAAPTDLHGIPQWLHLECKAMMPVFKLLVRMTGPTFTTHTTVFEFLDLVRTSKIPLVSASFGQIENWLADLASFAINGTIISSRKMSPEAKRKFWAEEIAVCPMKLLLDFARAAATREFRTRDGRPLFFPEKIDTPTEVVSASRDDFAAPEGQIELYARLGTRTKRIVDLTEARHLDPLVADRPHAEFLGSTIDFHDDPAAAVKRAPAPVFKGVASLRTCESYLTAP